MPKFKNRRALYMEKIQVSITRAYGGKAKPLHPFRHTKNHSSEDKYTKINRRGYRNKKTTSSFK